jgi:hypothetical protein
MRLIRCKFYDEHLCEIIPYIVFFLDNLILKANIRHYIQIQIKQVTKGDKYV